MIQTCKTAAASKHFLGPRRRHPMASSLLRLGNVQELLLLLCALFHAASHSAHAGKLLLDATSSTPVDPLDVWVIAGQSNAVGFNYMDGQPMPRPCSVPLPGKLVMFSAANQSWMDAVPSVAYISSGYPNMHSAIGPEFTFGRQLIDQNISSRVGLVATAVSNTDLCNNWKPPRGTQWLNMIQTIQAALAAAGPSAQLQGLLWVQGENDGLNFNCANAYQRNFRSFVLALRQATRKYHAQLPVVTAIMSTTNRRVKLPYIDIVRQNQMANDMLLPGLVKVDLEGLEFYNQNPGQAAYWLHLTKSGQCTLGANMAEAWSQAGLR